MVETCRLASLIALSAAFACSAESENAPSEDPNVACQEPAVAASLPIAISGAWHFCAVLEDGGVRCWGDWHGLQTPIGDVPVGRFDDGSPWRVPGAVCMRSVVVGLESTCAINRDGIAYCWGDDSGDELGNGPGRRYEPHPVPVLSLPPVRLLSGGVARIAVGRDNDLAYEWGVRSSSPSAPYEGTPVSSSFSFDNITRVGGEAYRCVVYGKGKLDCWGRNHDGVLGDGTEVARDLPQAVLGVGSVRTIRTAMRTVCAVTEIGEVWCWGWGDLGQLGWGAFESSLVPVRVQGIEDAADVVVGGLAACALHENGRVSCWGASPMTGPNGPDHGTAVPVEVPGVENVVQLAATSDTVLALLADGTLLWWGEGYFPPILLDKFPRQVAWDEVLDE